MSEIALTVSVLALVAVVGLWIGNVKIRGVGFGIGGVLFGGFCSYLVQRYRRNMVCQLSILGVVVCHSVIYYLDTFWNLSLIHI